MKYIVVSLSIYPSKHMQMNVSPQRYGIAQTPPLASIGEPAGSRSLTACFHIVITDIIKIIINVIVIIILYNRLSP